MYSSGEGRWLSPDPIGGDISNPQSLNRYAYVLNNPTSLIDPLGLQWITSGANPADPCNDFQFAISHAQCPRIPSPGVWCVGGYCPPFPPGGGGGGGGGGGSGGGGAGGGGGRGGTPPGGNAAPPDAGCEFGGCGGAAPGSEFQDGTAAAGLSTPWIIRVTSWGWPYIVRGLVAAAAGVEAAGATTVAAVAVVPLVLVQTGADPWRQMRRTKRSNSQYEADLVVCRNLKAPGARARCYESALNRKNRCLDGWDPLPPLIKW